MPPLAPLTRELARQAVENYAGELGPLPLEALARTGEWHRQLRRAAMVSVPGIHRRVGRPFVGFYAVEFARFTDPFGDHPPYSFTQLAHSVTRPGREPTYFTARAYVVKVKASGRPAEGCASTGYRRTCRTGRRNPDVRQRRPWL